MLTTCRTLLPSKLPQRSLTREGLIIHFTTLQLQTWEFLWYTLVNMQYAKYVPYVTMYSALNNIYLRHLFPQKMGFKEVNTYALHFPITVISTTCDFFLT